MIKVCVGYGIFSVEVKSMQNLGFLSMGFMKVGNMKSVFIDENISSKYFLHSKVCSLLWWHLFKSKLWSKRFQWVVPMYFSYIRRCRFLISGGFTIIALLEWQAFNINIFFFFCFYVSCKLELIILQVDMSQCQGWFVDYQTDKNAH